MSKKLNVRTLKTLGLSFLLGGMGGLAIGGSGWLLEENGLWSEPERGGLVLSLFSMTLFLPLFYFLFRQRETIEALREKRENALLCDDMTRLYKSKVFKELAAVQIRLCKRNGWPISLVLTDIDGLSKINEERSYDTGNQVLKHFAGVLKETVRESDLVARFDDDRFVVLLPKCDINGAREVVQRFQSRILSSPLKVEGREVKIPFSCGVVSFAGRVAKFRHLMNRADEALKLAKRKGGNRIELF